jgi:response regulator RpfG family c-di-GMP phosphodiesterase
MPGVASMLLPSLAIAASLATVMRHSATRVLPRPSFLEPNGARPQPENDNLLEGLVNDSIVLAEDLDALPAERRQALFDCRDLQRLLTTLVESGLLTNYQASRIQGGTAHGLVLGSYRVLDRLGAGGMGVVFRAEHLRMRKKVAIKVLPIGPDQDPRLLRRFMTEIRAIAQLQHPNIVGAMDCGEVAGLDPNASILHYFVMEYVPGQDLEELVRVQGPMSVIKACDVMHQIASALGEAHKHNLVHRDIKPSNIQVTPDGQAKLLDFGLARQNSTGMTEQGALLGTLDYMAPEQVQDARAVDIRADLYSLGGVLCWCLTGQPPFPPRGSFAKDLAARLTQQPPTIRDKRPEIDPALERLIQRLMALHAHDRFATPQEVAKALVPFLKPELRDHIPAVSVLDTPLATASSGAFTSRQYQVLLVDDETGIRHFCKQVLEAEGLKCDEADSGQPALRAVRAKDYDLLILDVNLPDMSGPDVCRWLRDHSPLSNLKIIMASGQGNVELMTQMLLSGADDFVTKPFSVMQLQARVHAALKLKDAQDRSDQLHRHLRTVNRELAQTLKARDSDLIEARNALVLALAKLVEQRASETGSHLVRLQKYLRCLAEEAGRLPPLAANLDEPFIELLECCAPLHDIGKVGLPDHILLKPGKLDAEERAIMQAHTLIGAETLEEVAKTHLSAGAFLEMGIAITRHHHERYDGTGYPDRLVGQAIPLAARLVGIADVYDALRSRRSYKPALSHSAAVQMILDGAGNQFDPLLIQAFTICAPQFDRIFRDNPD